MRASQHTVRGVAQPGRALPSGGRCRRFESSHPDQRVSTRIEKTQSRPHKPASPSSAHSAQKPSHPSPHRRHASSFPTISLPSAVYRLARLARHRQPAGYQRSCERRGGMAASSCCGGYSHSRRRPIAFSISGSKKASSSLAKLMLTPRAPARPVRPIRCT